MGQGAEKAAPKGVTITMTKTKPTKFNKPSVVVLPQEGGGYKIWLAFYNRPNGVPADFQLDLGFLHKKDAKDYAKKLAKIIGGRVLK